MRYKIIKLISVVFVLAVLIACGGGGGSAPPPGTNTDCVIGTSTIGDCTI
jgi:hypothetical protein